MSERDLIRTLYKKGAITVTDTTDGPEIDCLLRNVIYDDVFLRNCVASAYRRTLDKIYHGRNSNTHKYSGSQRYNVIGMARSIAPIMGMLRCPIVTLLPETLETDHELIHGHIVPDSPHVIVDDVLRTGASILSTLAYWIRRRYLIDNIVVFTSTGQGGYELIKHAFPAITEEYLGVRRDIEIHVIAPHKKIIASLAT